MHATTESAIATKEDLLKASQRIAPYIHNTPVLTSATLDEMTGSQLFFKCENLQKMGAFKMRGATNALLSLTEEQKQRGVATHSSGNFAQALALAAQLNNVKAYIVMPENASEVKKSAVRGYGAEIITCEPTLQAREGTLKKVVADTNATFIHPYDQREVIIGNSTAAQELIKAVKELTAIIAPVGGGGLISGTALAAHHFSPETIIYGGEPTGADDAFRSLKAGMIIPSENPDTIADGLLTSLGKLNFPIIQQLVKEIFTVEEDEIIIAMKLVWERMKIIIEPSSAVALAAILKHKEVFHHQRVGIILSGGNIDLKKLPFKN